MYSRLAQDVLEVRALLDVLPTELVDLFAAARLVISG